MKKLLLFLALAACLLSCRSVKNEGSIAAHHYGVGADTLAALSYAERTDSSSYFRGVIDSLSSELKNVRLMYRNLYVRDSMSTNQYRADREHVKDTTWMERNADGSITFHHYRETNTYSFQQFESYRKQIAKESKATIDSLIERNTYLQAQYDSVSRYKLISDSLSIYKAKFDSISSVVSEKEKTVVEKFDFWSRVKLVSVTIVICAIVAVIVFVYLRFFRR